jgi:hypothetical protein
MWIDAPPGVVEVLERWALVRHVPDRLHSDPRGSGDEADLRVQPSNGHPAVELEAFPGMLDKALPRAISKWWAAEQHDDSTRLHLQSKDGQDWLSPPPRVNPDDPPPPWRLTPTEVETALQKIFSHDLLAKFVGRTTTVVEEARVVWETEDVSLRFILGQPIEVSELVGRYPDRAPTRQRPERVQSIKPRPDHIAIKVDVDDRSVPHWSLGIRLPPRVAKQ